MLSHGGGERDDIVLGDLFDLLYASDVESAALSDVARRLRRHDPRAGHRLGGGCLNLQPRLVPSLFTPHPTHFRACVPCNHRRVSTRLARELFRTYPSDSLSGGNCKPLTAPSTVAESALSEKRCLATRCTSSTLTCSTPSRVSSSPT